MFGEENEFFPEPPTVKGPRTWSATTFIQGAAHQEDLAFYRRTLPPVEPAISDSISSRVTALASPSME